MCSSLCVCLVSSSGIAFVQNKVNAFFVCSSPNKLLDFKFFLKALENFWKLWKNFHQFYKQSKTYRSIWFMVVLFVFYVDWISVVATVVEITLMSRKNSDLGSVKINSLPWRTPAKHLEFGYQWMIMLLFFQKASLFEI